MSPTVTQTVSRRGIKSFTHKHARVGGESALEVRRPWISNSLATNTGQADGYQTSRAGVELKMFTLSHYSSKYLLSVRGAGAEEEQGQTGCLGPEGLMGEQPWSKDTGGQEGDGRQSTLLM